MLARGCVEDRVMGSNSWKKKPSVQRCPQLPPHLITRFIAHNEYLKSRMCPNESNRDKPPIIKLYKLESLFWWWTCAFGESQLKNIWKSLAYKQCSHFKYCTKQDKEKNIKKTRSPTHTTKRFFKFSPHESVGGIQFLCNPILLCTSLSLALKYWQQRVWHVLKQSAKIWMLLWRL